ncbi:MFS transporter [Plastoroseomonas hellenica]|uniref:MFS transporter n=1 Tax=Plastoroseomonas hellenica TaxID=2687306 RepID=UPI001BAA12E3|nr:MFS transporter [Plastoroseomonas hellenica]MBR0647457.1 MFS transporter [Plastoroseomonas hellenica]
MSIFLRVTLPLAGMNFVNQMARAVIATIGPPLALELGLSASGLGLLAAAIFVTYAMAQLPVGLALDLFGARRTQTVLASIAAIGCVISAMAPDALLLGVGRMVTGIGIAAGLMGMLQANTQWYPRERVATVTGRGVFIAALGGLSATLPVQWLLPSIGWRGAFWGIAAIASGVAIWIWNSVPDRPPGATARTPRRLWDEVAEYGRIFQHAGFLRFLPGIAMISALNFTMMGLWAGPWLRDVGGLADQPRAAALLCLALGMTLGSLMMGQWTTRMQERGWPGVTVPALALAGQAVMLGVLLTRPQGGLAVLGPVWFVFGFVGAGGPPGYAALAQVFPRELAGRVATAINFTMLLIVVFLQNAIGWVLDLWPRTAAGGWDPAGYGAAFGGMLLLHIASGCAMLRFGQGRGLT